MNRPFPVGARVKRKLPPPGIVVGYIKENDKVAIRWDDTDILQFLPPNFVEWAPHEYKSDCPCVECVKKFGAVEHSGVSPR